ncbi:Pre-rRNA-processing protein rix1 [Hypsizygus marmoreus]|uniref:Pre-rRNA-processing protein RIX1 n=1 Tax=Hypsizygus marmoreus TaxID=39966 RepID=A0A369JN19_HYPMA|nr:Pre-rRNA-processing protein rix1 [Hypsizygus marmoreus]
MEPSHPLKALLQLQLATDSSAVLHLPYTLASLTHECLLPSSHLSKWTTRINSLLHSKDAGARWAGLCLAYKTSLLSRNTMIEYAQSWLGVALPMLSKNEPVPNLKAAIRLLRIIFSTAIGIPEFQRQVATPNVPKFNVAIIGLAEKHSDDELKILILESLTKLVPLYPTLNRASHAALSALTLRFLSGNAPNPTRMPLLEAASQLYSVLPHTGGKVGAANLWRKSVDETLAFGWSAFFALRTTFPTEGRNASRDTAVSTDEAVMAIPLNVDRLRCCTVVLCNLLSATTQRLVQLPLGPLVKFTTTLLLCTKDDKGKEHIDPTVHAMELSIIPEMWKSSCNLISCLAKCARHHLTPNLTRLVSYLTFHLEQKPTAAQRLILLTTVQALLVHCHPLDSPLIPTRLAKAILPSLAVILATPSEVQASADSTASSNKNKKGKKRARAYEGDEVFKLSREVICPNADDGKVLLAALEVMRLLLRNPNLSPAMQSISARVLLSVLLALPQMTPASLSRDPGLHRELHQLVQTVNTELGSGTTSVMSKSLGLVIRSTISGEDHDEAFRQLEILIHPRVPPLVRSLPHVEALSLFRAEEPQEEIDVREELGLHGVLPDAPPSSQDVDMEDDITPSPYVQDTALEPMKAPPIPKLNASLDSAPENPSYSAPQKPGPQIPTSSLKTPPLPKVAIPPPPSPSAPMQPMVAAADDEEDEEMPAINMDSDSEEDE